MTQSAPAPAPQDFVESILQLRPRVAVFDCDGTLWSGDAGAEFFYWEIEHGLISPEVAAWALPRYRDYKAGKVDEETMCGEMVTIHRGINVENIRHAAAEFFHEHVAKRIFPELQELTRRLAEKGCHLWAVSSTNEWVITEGVRRFGIPAEHVIAACVQMDGDRASARLLRVPTGQGKAKAIREVIGRPISVAFGNSVHDAAMLEVARHAFAINPNPDLEIMAAERDWTIYKPIA
ncbi:MAG TPA: haloacid dehalogenase-like hydrolase [Clostridia bacterium]|nr:haloacid dehalogenase-like hydrolase [Clostridia bacterium]